MRQARSARAWIVLTGALGIAAGLLLVAQAALVARIVHAAFLDGRPPGTLFSLFMAAAGVVAARAVLGWAREAAGFEAGAQVRETVRSTLVAHLVSLGPLYCAGRPSGALGSTLMENVEALHDFFARYLPQLLLAAVVPAAFLLFVFPLSWAAGGLLLLTAPLIPIFMVLIGMGAESISQRQFQSLARMSAHFLDVLQGIATLKLFDRARDETQRVADVSADFRKRTMKVLRVAFLSSAVLEFFTSISIALVAVYLGLGYLGYIDFGAYGRPLTLESGLFILFLAPDFYLPLRELGAYYHSRADAIGAAEEILKIFRQAPETPDQPMVPVPERGIACIRFDRVSLSYDSGRRPALQDISFELRAGEQVVIAGRSGAGKSTILNLLLKFAGPFGGKIQVDGTPLERIDPERWRRHLAWIGQEPMLFHGSLEDNIRMGRPGASEAEVAAAVRAAFVSDFVHQLPEGLDTPVGEQGLGLSRGQAQRVALARAFLKNAPVLLLDEPTASLDADNEALIMAAIENLARDRTVLMATHRLAHVPPAARILVMERGRIVEQGTRGDLIKAGGLFHRLAAPRTESRAS